MKNLSGLSQFLGRYNSSVFVLSSENTPYMGVLTIKVSVNEFTGAIVRCIQHSVDIKATITEFKYNSISSECMQVEVDLIEDGETYQETYTLTPVLPY